MTTLAHVDGLFMKGAEIRFPDFDITWVGGDPSGDRFCFGSDDGRLRWADWKTHLADMRATESGEAINGAAFAGAILAVSTRKEIVVWTNPLLGRRLAQVTIPYGSHGIVATASGHFAAPLGREGVMLVGMGTNGLRSVTAQATDKDNELYFYRAISIPSHRAAPGEVLFCATRSQGVALVTLGGDASEAIVSVAFRDVDVVDVCSLGTGRAACALAKNGTLAFFRDVVDRSSPVAIRFSEIEGTAYRVLSGAGHVFLLTDTRCFLFPGLASRFLAGEPIESQSTRVLEQVVEAVDATLYRDRWLFLVLPDHVRVLDFGALSAQPPDPGGNHGSRHITPKPMTANWRFQNLAATLTPVG